MCGIAGYSLSGSSSVDRTLSAQSLLAGIAERGADAVGYAHRGPSGPVEVRKQRSGASALLDQITVPPDAIEALVHVRDYTKGHPSIAANNHPVRHGPVVGIHNGIIANDDELFERYGWRRAEPEMTVDSEAIFALAEASENRAEALEQLYGAMATAWVDERRPACSSSPAASAARSGSAAATVRSSSPRHCSRSRPSSATPTSASRSARCPRARWSRSPTAASHGPSASARTRRSSRKTYCPGPHARRGRALPQRLAALAQAV